MGNSSTVLVGHIYIWAKLSKNGKALLDEFVLTIKEQNLTDEEEIVTVTKKLQVLSKDFLLPKILFLNFDDLKNMNSFARCPENTDLTVDLESIDRNNSFLVFISHCWLRGHPAAEGWDCAML